MAVCKVITFVTGLLCVALGCVVLVVFPRVYRELIIQNVVLGYKNNGFQMWESPPFPIHFQIWVWNVSNPDEVASGGKPYLTQRGPYTYQETKNKENVTFSDHDEAISYVTPAYYEFVPEMSVGDPKEENVTTMNIPYLTVVNMAQSMSIFERAGVKAAIFAAHSQLFQSLRVHDLLWGYKDPLLALLQPISGGRIKTSIFGLFAEKRNKSDGVYVIDSGKNDYAKTSQILSFNGEDHLDFWTTNASNMINGTDGTYYHPYLKKDEKIYIFSSDICRSIYIAYEQDNKISGVPAYRFVAPPSVFWNTTANPDNIGYCTPQTNCLPGGLLNVSICQQGAPVVMSLPHFLFADEEVFTKVDGEINPNKEEHQTAFDLEPTTGGPLQVFKRLQINVHSQAYPDFADFKNLQNNTFLPIMWLNESSVLPKDSAGQVLWITTYIWTVVGIVQWTLIAVGAILAVVAIVSLTVMRKAKKPLLVPTNNPSENSPLLGNKA